MMAKKSVNVTPTELSTTEQKTQALLFAGTQAFAESVRFSNLIWKHSLAYSSLMFAVVIATVTTEGAKEKPMIGWIIIILLLVALYWCQFMLKHCHQSCELNRKILNKCRLALLLFQRDAYLLGETILPENWLSEMVREDVFLRHRMAVFASCGISVLILLIFYLA